MITTIQIEKKVKNTLTKLKLYERETYNDVIERLIEDTQELDEETRRSIKIGLADVKAGRVKTHEQVGRELGF